MAKTTKSRRLTNAETPQTDADAARILGEIGDLTRELERHKASADATIARIGEQVAEARAPLVERKAELEQGLQAYCEANRDRLTQGGKRKFFEFGTGRVSWRMRPPKVSIRNAQEVILNFVSLGMNNFLRTKTEIDKDAILADPEAAQRVKGVSVGSAGEDFVIEPAELKTSEAA